MNSIINNSYYLILTVCVNFLLLSCSSNEWIEIFDGKTLSGWSASENKDSWEIINGAIVTKGSRSHLFYNGPVNNHSFKNFEFSADVKSEKGSNSGIFFHTEYQESGWPNKGYECQILNNNSHQMGKGYVERKLTGSLYGIRNVWKSPAPDNEWFNYRIVVLGNTIRIYINGQLISDYTEPEKLYRPEGREGSYISSGTFALQCHDPDSRVYFKNLKVKPLSDEIITPGIPNQNEDLEKSILELSSRNFPLMDLHVHLKNGLSMEMALENARKFGFTYGLAVNCGIKMGYETENDLREFLNNYEKPPHTYLAMQAEGREWLDIFSEEIISEFDYVFTDAMTWTNKNGKRMRLWIEEETEIGDPNDFMDQLVWNIEQIISKEPIDIYVNATYLPREIDELYDELWTTERMDRVIKVLVENHVALEIGARYKIPSSSFIKRAKKASVKFTFGTNNSGPQDLGYIENCLNMIKECELEIDDLWIPNN